MQDSSDEDLEVVYDEDYDPQREEELKQQLATKQGSLSGYWAQCFNQNAGKYWHEFYKRNGNRFFKDRHYLDIVFDELNVLEKDGKQQLSLLEVGCGVGNAFFPLCEKYPSLQLYGCDFAKSAVEIIRNRAEFDKSRMTVWQADLVKDDISHEVPEEGCDVLLIMFVLSAVNPKNMDAFLDHALQGLKKGGVLLFRDYGRYDMAQIRFKPNRKIEDNWYARQDGTLAYFFDLDEVDDLFQRHGLKKRKNTAIRRCIRNRKTNCEMHRVWIQSIYEKMLIIC
ncbi:methyltransferase isoform a [Blastocystis sp. subtype 4]|uniref:methyltransferase isoform a n=1 Tax=Blastocystis sp. subtype 4 TaxID=944170 RepID=UPI000711EF10|nr:methyltransferase isoform a [Blastocystis sp. subtype 4]KNB44181.1 methyltransferase isoform a [Blastocystis sp. subtype 4]|eukprot:XP_014527624.1 methyltransferase isoform a [Blastocystis sp. subtype 4]